MHAHFRESASKKEDLFSVYRVKMSCEEEEKEEMSTKNFYKDFFVWSGKMKMGNSIKLQDCNPFLLLPSGGK